MIRQQVDVRTSVVRDDSRSCASCMAERSSAPSDARSPTYGCVTSVKCEHTGGCSQQHHV